MTVVFVIAAMINASAAGIWAAQPQSTERVVWIFGHMACFAWCMTRVLARRYP